MPQCEVCGECYYQWKVTLQSLSRNISAEVARAYNLSLTPVQPGSINAYDNELKVLEDKLKRVEEILKNQVTTENDTKAIEEQLDSVNSQLQDIQEKVEILDNEVNSTEMRNKEANIEIDRLRERLAELLKDGKQLKSDVEKILRSDIRGAFDEILKNQMRSREAEKKVSDAQEIINMVKDQRNKTEVLLAGPPSFSDKHEENNATFFDISEKIRELLEQVDVLNGIVCGTPSSQCGGCGVRNCSTCGGPGCNGSMSLAAEALERAREAEEAQRMREAKANETLEEVKNAEVMANMTLEAAEQAVMSAMEADEQAKNASSRMDNLIQDILDFLNQEFGDTDRIRKLVNSVKELKLSVTPEEIAKLAEDIKKALASLTGIDEILQETEERLNTANNLKERAEQARTKAKAVSDAISNITEALIEAAESQAAATNAINASEDDIKMAEDILKQVLADLDSLEKAVDIAQGNVTEMVDMVPMVHDQFKNNVEQLNITQQNALDAHNKSQTAQKEVDELLELFNKMKDQIKEKVESVQNASSQLTYVKDLTDRLVNSLDKKMKRVIVVEREIHTFEELLNETIKVQSETKIMLDKVERRYQCYYNCNPKILNNACFED